ncbi:rod-binding protein [Acetobacter oeni]|uniref:Chemotactic signal-response protein CheL n=1 Tax=Acetobacter oeni TaxID=304077 RepID=A0A511XKI6_9PROT|nr:rod-binding protein [Acetobacter oeni]MBB3881342.1 Rod binding domain-containing protein [Acetobacter oeni]NHO18214.1 chemotaxis protein chel [Acetobacter oeni]GBR11289.1 chemotactic signal-response protein CheL [Acetobacter oeni LMG 21952]GEN63464.1 chemotactic signal-response protein CheL [Acetobacter oeni]
MSSIKSATQTLPQTVSSTQTTSGEAAVDPKIWKTASDFEAMAIGQLLQPMFDTVDLSKTPFGGGVGESTFKPMMVEEMAKQMESKGGLGLAKSIYHKMLEIQENAG